MLGKSFPACFWYRYLYTFILATGKDTKPAGAESDFRSVANKLAMRASRHFQELGLLCPHQGDASPGQSVQESDFYHLGIMLQQRGDSKLVS